MSEDVRKLKVNAGLLREKLEYYANVDRDAAELAERMKPWFDRIEKGEVIPPTEDIYRWHFANTDAPLFKYRDLLSVAAQYSKALEKWSFPYPDKESE